MGSTTDDTQQLLANRKNENPRFSERESAFVRHKVQVAAETGLRSGQDLIESLVRTEQRALQVDRGRIGQSQARARAGAVAGDDSDLAFEERLAVGLRAVIRAASVRADTVGAMFVAARRATNNRLSGGL